MNDTLCVLPVLGDGLPGTLLLETAAGVPRYHQVLPDLGERNYRRFITKRLRRLTGLAGPDIIAVAFRLKSTRQRLFWAFMSRRRGDPDELDGHSSLELAILKEAVARLQPPDFDEDRFAALCPE